MPEERRWLSRLDQMIDEDMSKGPLYNRQLAGLIQISERHFIRKVKAHTSVSPQHYIPRRRLQRARQYLESGEYRTVREAAAAVGYASTSYFFVSSKRRTESGSWKYCGTGGGGEPAERHYSL